MTNEKRLELVKKALEAREKSYSPYSQFKVGAALLTSDGEIFMGANVENAAYTPTVCAERVAFFTAVHLGKRDFKAIAIVGGKASEPVSSYTAPCGVCRQVMAEFADGDFEIILFNGKDVKTYLFSELLPESFGKNDLK